MKKLFLMFALMLGMSFSAYAENYESSNADVVEAYTIKVNINSLVRFLDLANWQAVSMEDVHNIFSDVVRGAVNMDGEDRKKQVRIAINYVLRNVRWILNDEQYKKYLMAFNATLRNRRIEY